MNSLPCNPHTRDETFKFLLVVRSSLLHEKFVMKKTQSSVENCSNLDEIIYSISIFNSSKAHSLKLSCFSKAFLILLFLDACWAINNYNC